jgi:hypothetical protein
MVNIMLQSGCEMQLWWKEYREGVAEDSRNVVLSVMFCDSLWHSRLTSATVLHSLIAEHFLWSPLITHMCYFNSKHYGLWGTEWERNVWKTQAWGLMFLPSSGLFCFSTNLEALLEVHRKFGFLTGHKFRPLDILFLVDKHGWIFVNEKKINKALLRTLFFFSSLFLYFFWSRVKVSLC